jgi:hypothetical protein
VAVDSKGNLYIADTYNGIRRVDAVTEIMTTVVKYSAGGLGGDCGPATLGLVNQPHNVAVDALGDLYIADYANQRIRRVDAATGILTTAAVLPLIAPYGLALGASGNIYADDPYAFIVQEVINPGTGACTPTPTPTSTPTSTPTPLPCAPGYTGPQPPNSGECFTYPAPASGSQVTFVYDLQQAGKAQIRVWNEKTDLVAELSQEQGCGVQEEVLDLGRFAAGVYFYQVQLSYNSGRMEKLKMNKFLVQR